MTPVLSDGLPAEVRACLFDMDGVVTRTEELHARAWAKAFDAFLARCGGSWAPFDPVTDYDLYVDGRPRLDGVRTFLASRGITLREGEPDDPPGTFTVAGIGNAKNQALFEALRVDGVPLEPHIVDYIDLVRRNGRATAVVTSSANAATFLDRAGISSLFDERVDGIVARRLDLAGKPRPDTFLEATRRLGVHPARAAVFEDSIAGVRAGKEGGFGLVVGVARVPERIAVLRSSHADIVVQVAADLMDPRRVAVAAGRRAP